MMEHYNRPANTASTNLPPKVEITIEQLDGIVWSTSKNHQSRDEAKKHVPFVTATVEFSGTCPSMKVYSASKYPNIKNPAVESFFASINEERMQNTTSEVKKIVSTTTQEAGVTTTTTTTTTITTIQDASPKLQEGHYPLTAKWHDESTEEKLIDSVDFFAKSCDEANSIAQSGFDHGKKANRPHLSMTLPTTAEQQNPSILAALLSPCQHKQYKSDAISMGEDGANTTRKVELVNTSSTAESTIGSAVGTNLSDLESLQAVVSPAQSQKESILETSFSPLLALGSLMDKDSNGEEEDDNDTSNDSHDSENEQLKGIQTAVTRQDEANVAPVLATKKSKELVATAIAAESSSAVMGQTEVQAGAFTPLSWMACGAPSPEIIEMRVRIMPEDEDEIDASSTMEGVAHLVFLDQIIEEGTTVMDLPLKMAHEPKAMTRDHTYLSTAPIVGGGDCVSLNANAMLRVRVTILPQRGQEVNHTDLADFHQVLRGNATMKTQSTPEGDHFLANLPSLQSQLVLPLLERFKHINFQYFVGENGKTDGHKSTEKNNPTIQQKKGAFPHAFPTLIQERESNKVESFLGERKSYGETWSWLKAFSALTRKESFAEPQGKREKPVGEARKDKKHFYTIPPAARSSSELTGILSADSDTLEVFML